jgi:hypothetical protein
MSLTQLFCYWTPVSDLSTLRGMPLTDLRFFATTVSDLSPLEGMKLTTIVFTPKNITKGIAPIRQMKSLKTIATGLADKDQFPPAEFWKKYDAGEFNKPTSAAVPADRKPITTFNAPAFQRWMKEVAALPAEKQVEAVAKKLQELNPGFDGKVNGFWGNDTPKIENGVVTGFGICTDNVTDISPVRALERLRSLGLGNDRNHRSKFSDLSPLKGMPLTTLDCSHTPVSDLSPLQGMSLTSLGCVSTQVSDLSPLKGMRLTGLNCACTQVADLLPLKGMPLTVLWCDNTQVSDLSPLERMNLTVISFTPKNITKGIDLIRQMNSLKTIAVGYEAKDQFPPAEFWKKYDAGEFSK